MPPARFPFLRRALGLSVALATLGVGLTTSPAAAYPDRAGAIGVDGACEGELLRLHNLGDAAAGERQIAGLAAVRSAPAYARVAGEHGVAFARGRRVEVELDEEQFPGGGAFLFASVLERFLALSASMNSFTQLVARSRQRRRPVGEWPPRAGWRTLV